MNHAHASRDIPYNYTSADDRRAGTLLLGAETWNLLDNLRHGKLSGRPARLVLRFLGEILVHRRNPFLFQELVDSTVRRGRLFQNVEKDLAVIADVASGHPEAQPVLLACRKLLDEFRADVEGAPELRRKLVRELGDVVGAANVLVDPFSLVSHATDATDWRLHLPVAVVMPQEERHVAPLLQAVGKMGLHAVPRGAGTGLTGGAVPLHPRCVVINTEKMDQVRGIRQVPLADGSAHALEVEAGVITETAMEHAAHQGLVFATDPTSAWACTIGGNIAENAGGKDSVLWGTCIDNLLEWRMAMPGGQRWTVRRVDHPRRKILPHDTVSFEVVDEAGLTLKRVDLPGTQVRKKGLWKDITNKALGGVPGLQKEGTDGVITSAVFILYPEYQQTRTLCLEFFGPDMEEASRVILELARAFPFADQGQGALRALEHFDDEYVRAIQYKVKAPRAETPKAVLLIDVVGHTEEEVTRGVERVRATLRHTPNTLLFEARDAAESTRFWADRKKMGAIARRTNAFKMNEDVVLPLEGLAEFARFIDQANVEEERHAQGLFIARVEAALQASGPAGEGERADDKLQPVLERCGRARETLAHADPAAVRSLLVINGLRDDLAALLQGYPKVAAVLERAHVETRERRIVLATHMHAGDGNVHVNIPVLSNDRPMLERADNVVDRVMAKVVALGGVVSGEHGIGITKLKYLEPERLAELEAYRRQVDPGGLMNPGKLSDTAVLGLVFTPSFNLLKLEARILQHGQLEELARKIAHCVRCGRCKPDCCVHLPARGMFYNPRNKNLAVGSLIEALLYDAQRERTTHFELLRWLEEVADHCTICHKCLKPCPVDIDTGAVSVLERETLTTWGHKHSRLATRLTLGYLESQSPSYNAVFRTGVMRVGGAVQRAGSRLVRPLQPRDRAPGHYGLQVLRSPVPPVPARTLRDELPPCGPDEVLILEPEEGAQRTVLYFPGCGSERMQSTVSMAALHLLGQRRTRVVLPPPFLCCGFPLHVNAYREAHARTALRDSIIFSQVNEMLSYLSFDACVVTCGTCREALLALEAEKLFGGRIVDAARYAAERGLRLTGEGAWLYHPPCHDSLEGKALEVLGQVGGFGKVRVVPHCCSEAGTLALSRPDITDALLQRKQEALRAAIQEDRSARVVLTNCPSCLQGLGRSPFLGLAARHVVVAMAEKLSGPGWVELFRNRARTAQAMHF